MQRQAVDLPCCEHALLEPGEPDRGDAAAGEAVLLEDLGKRGRGTGRRIGIVPVTRTELLGDRLDFRARGRFRDRERVGGQPPVREESLGHAYAADLERLQTFGLEPATRPISRRKLFEPRSTTASIRAGAVDAVVGRTMARADLGRARKANRNGVERAAPPLERFCYARWSTVPWLAFPIRCRSTISR